ncbi:MAG: ABC transporter ATP-binding protein [Clostridia bacterium]
METKINKAAKRKVSITGYYSKYWLFIAISTFFLIFQSSCELQLPEYMAKIISEGIAISEIGNILKYGGIMLAISCAEIVAAIIVGYFASKAGTYISRDLRYDCFSQVIKYSAKEYTQFDLSSLITRSTNDITQIQNFTIMFLRMIMFAPIMAIGGIIKAATIAKGMGSLAWVIVIAVVALIAIIIVLLVIVQPKFMRMQKQIDEVNQVANDELNGMLVIRAFSTQGHEQKRFAKANQDLTKTSLFTSRTMGLLMPFMTLVMNSVSLAVVWVASYTAEDIVQVVNTMAFIQYAMYIIMSFMFISMIFVLLPRARVSVGRIKEILEKDISITNKEGKEEQSHPILDGDIEFHDVDFSYGSDENVLDDISFVTPKGTTTAIIGSTGSGKSTLINLLPRLIDATKGYITIGGVDIRDYNIKDLRENIAFVPQKNVLFSGTIESNICYGSEDCPEGQIDKSIRISQSTGFVKDKPNGVKSEIAQGGANVSGGQKQRLAIARAINKNAPIYIFDDSFSALDFKTDAQLRRAISEELGNVTVIIVAQRVGTIKNADQIIVLDDGRIVGKGKHSDLLQTCPTYRAIASSQLSEEELNK